MKKSLSLLLVLTLILGMFVLVGNHKDEADEEQDSLSVAVVVSSAFGDKSFNDSAHIQSPITFLVISWTE